MPRSRVRPRLAAMIGTVLALAACAESLPPPLASAPAPVPVLAAPPPPRPYRARPKGHFKVGAEYTVKGMFFQPGFAWDYDEVGTASWYGPGFHRRLTANGEEFDQNEMTAAHATLPLPSVVRVTNLDNGRSVVLRVNDRGPFVPGRLLDVSRRAAQLLGFLGKGLAPVRIQLLEDESRKAARELGWKG